MSAQSNTINAHYEISEDQLEELSGVSKSGATVSSKKVQVPAIPDRGQAPDGGAPFLACFPTLKKNPMKKIY